MSGPWALDFCVGKNCLTGGFITLNVFQHWGGGVNGGANDLPALPRLLVMEKWLKCFLQTLTFTTLE